MSPQPPLTILNQQLALLQDPAPVDFDPEAIGGFETASEGERSDDGDDDDDGGEGEGNVEGVERARAHYVAVGKSQLRAGAGAEEEGLGDVYVGSRVARAEIYGGEEGDVEIEDAEDGDVSGDEVASGEDEEIDSDEAMGSGDEERFEGYKFAGSRTTPGGVVPERGDRVVEDEDDEAGDSEDEDEGENQEESGGSGESGDEHGEEDEGSVDEAEDAERRKRLSRMIAEEQKTTTANITKAAQNDAEKGAAVRHQQGTFDSFLSARIKFQKALAAINSLPPTGLENPLSDTPSAHESWKAAEASALKLWNTLYTLRTDLGSSRDANPKKRKAPGIDEGTPIDEIWAHMRTLESEATHWREAVLEKWSNKTQTSAVSIGRKLNNTVPRSLTASIREALSTDHTRLVNRTRVPRGAAPLQAETGVEADPEVFDDTDLYQQLLKALVDQRMVDSSAGGAVGWTAAMRDAKRRKGKVDTKASKGRRLRYHVHEKLQNFMAPQENNAWQESQITELFSSLLGQRVRVDEDDDEEAVDEDIVLDNGLRLFG